MMYNNNYHNCKLVVKTIVVDSLSSFFWAYCKTVGMPSQLEQHFIRKAVSFTKLSKYVRQHITNDFDAWYRLNRNTTTFYEVVANMINAEDDRTETYRYNTGAKLVSNTFTLPGWNLPLVLVQR